MEIVTALIALVIFATIIEFVVNVLKGLLPAVAQKYITPLLLAACVGILLALMFKLDIFAMLGYTGSLPAVAQVITGLIISAGSVPVHELIAKLRESRNSADASEPIYYTNTITNIAPKETGTEH